MRRPLAVAALVLALAACARKAPPAPVLHGGAADAMVERPESVVVQRGETLYGIARRWQVPVRALIETNNLQPPYGLLAGTRLKLPQLRIHTVQPGETLSAVARRYGLDAASLARTNQLEAPYTIRVGEMLLLPEPVAVATAAPTPAAKPPPAQLAPPTAEPGPPPATVAVVPVPPPEASAPAPSEARAPPPSPPPVVEAKPPPPEPPPLPAPPAGRGFIWPVKGRILSGFGPGAGGTFNDGINIAAAEGTPIVAAEDGVVAYVGNELRGFGNLVLLKHPNGWMSAYAHCNQTLVKKGARVRRGQMIARVGMTGAVGEPQLHFELRRGTRALDPTQQLPSA